MVDSDMAKVVKDTIVEYLNDSADQRIQELEEALRDALEALDGHVSPSTRVFAVEYRAMLARIDALLTKEATDA